MKKILVFFLSVVLCGCCHNDKRVFHAAGFDIEEGQEIKDFFDDFEEPMHARYVGNNMVKWTYYVDYDRDGDDGEIVRYCDLDDYSRHQLCPLVVHFHNKKVASATSGCY